MSWQTRLSALLEAVGDVWSWSLDRVRSQLPDGLRALGWHDVAGVFRLSVDGQREAVGIRQQSWLGEIRVRPADADACEAQSRHSLVLPEARQFRTSISLSRLAARRGRAALDLRQDRFMPLADGQGCYAHEVGAESEEGGLFVDIAVVRKADLDRTKPDEASGKTWEIAGDLGPEGRSRFVLAKGGQAGLSSGVKPVVLYALFLVAVFAWQGRLQNMADAERNAQRDQAVAVRQLREAEAELDGVETQRSVAGAPVYLGHVLESLAALPDSLEADGRIQRLRLGNRRELELVIARDDGDDMTNQALVLPLKGGDE